MGDIGVELVHYDVLPTSTDILAPAIEVQVDMALEPALDEAPRGGARTRDAVPRR